MKNYVEYKGMKLKITASRAIEIEDKLGGGIAEKMRGSTDEIRTLSTILASAIADGSYEERKNTALAIYDEMIDEGKNISDYQFLVSDVLVAAGFIRGEVVALQKKIVEKQMAALAKSAEKTEALQN